MTPNAACRYFKTAALGLIKSSASEIVAISSGVEAVTDEQAAARLAVCNSCEHLRMPDAVCSICKCYMNRKTRWRSAVCPLNPPKW